MNKKSETIGYKPEFNSFDTIKIETEEVYEKNFYITITITIILLILSFFGAI